MSDFYVDSSQCNACEQDAIAFHHAACPSDLKGSKIVNAYCTYREAGLGVHAPQVSQPSFAVQALRAVSCMYCNASGYHYS